MKKLGLKLNLDKFKTKSHPLFVINTPLDANRQSTSSPSAISQETVAPLGATQYLDASGKLNFEGKAILHQEGVDFSNGQSFKINMKELEIMEELGKGQYGVVMKVHHVPTNVTMAMKQIRLDVSEVGLKQILMELDVLHNSTCPYIVEFYGAFFIEANVYYCMEYMDAGSLDRLCVGGVPEDVLSRIAKAMVCSLSYMKEELHIIHRDVKPTNILVNRGGHVKLCDFGVSGRLIQSVAKTYVGCQNYMAPERIACAQLGPYSVQSDVWSLGLALMEIALGEYPYGKFDNMFAQLSAIVDGPPPNLSKSRFSEDCRDFMTKCLNKDPHQRPTFQRLLEHSFIKKYENAPVDMAGWVKKVLDQQNRSSRHQRHS